MKMLKQKETRGLPLYSVLDISEQLQKSKGYISYIILKIGLEPDNKTWKTKYNHPTRLYNRDKVLKIQEYIRKGIGDCDT